MKIVDILIGTGMKGGVENVINLIGTKLRRRGYLIRVVQLVWEGYEWVDKSLEFYPVFSGRGEYNVKTLASGYGSVLKEHGNPDLIIAANWPIISLIARETISSMNIDCKILSWLHNPLDKYAASGYGGIEYLKLADAHLAINNHIARDIKSGIKDAEVYKVKNAVDFSRLVEKTSDDNRRKVSNTLLFIGRIENQKRVDILIDAVFGAKEKWKIKIIGEGDFKESLQARAQQYNMEDRIEWIGWKDNPWDYAYDCAYFIMTSDYEGFPLTAIEANAYGLPVISTPVDGIVELINPGVNGYIVPFNNPAALREVLDYISDGVLPLLSAEDCIKAAEKYEVGKVTLEFEEVINKYI